MYVTTSELGQVDLPKSETAQNIEATAELTRAITEPAADAFAIHSRTEINKERIKAGLPLLGTVYQLPPPLPQQEDNFAFGIIALLVIGYLIMSKS